MIDLDTVRVLSIRRPWSELIMAGVKPVENRPWSTSWRGRQLLVHAGARWESAGAALAARQGHPVDRDTAPTGYLGLVELVDVHPDTGCCQPCGQPGTYHWRLTWPRRFAEPVPGRGRLGLCRPPRDDRAALAAALADLADAGGRR